MSPAASVQQPSSLPKDEHDHLSVLLTRKLRNIPYNHIPALQLSDILHQTHLARHIPNIPPDLQLAFFLRHRALIDRANGKPLKNTEAQSRDVTRAIWYYRVDLAHQFQRYHDTTRWNLAIFAALLTDIHDEKSIIPPPSTHGRSKQPRQKDTYLSIPPAAQRFMTSYLRAVMEHHNTPSHFSARESFLRTWKEGVWEVFTRFSAGQKKMLKNEMKGLMKEWETEVEYAERQMGRAAYEGRVKKFVGSVVPGRREQEVSARQAESEKAVGGMSKVANREAKTDEDRSGKKNELLEALCVPVGEEGEVAAFEDGITVTDLRYAIGLVRKVRPRNMLPVLMRLFPSEDAD